MDISKLIAHADKWAGDIALIKRAIAKAEQTWNTTNDNNGVVQKIITKEDLLAADSSEEVQQFIAALPTE